LSSKGLDHAEVDPVVASSPLKVDGSVPLLVVNSRSLLIDSFHQGPTKTNSIVKALLESSRNNSVPEKGKSTEIEYIGLGIIPPISVVKNHHLRPWMMRMI
jgi:hypothetical protein